MKKITCEYCHTRNSELNPSCDACGAPFSDIQNIRMINIVGGVSRETMKDLESAIRNNILLPQEIRKML